MGRAGTLGRDLEGKLTCRRLQGWFEEARDPSVVAARDSRAASARRNEFETGADLDLARVRVQDCGEVGQGQGQWKGQARPRTHRTPRTPDHRSRDAPCGRSLGQGVYVSTMLMSPALAGIGGL